MRIARAVHIGIRISTVNWYRCLIAVIIFGADMLYRALFQIDGCGEPVTGIKRQTGLSGTER